MGEFICFCLGVLELAVSFTIICIGILVLCYCKSISWEITTDKVQFLNWLKGNNDESE